VWGFAAMNKSKLAGSLLLLVSIISPSCDSKPKPAPAEPAPTEQAPTEPPTAEQTPAAQEQTEQAPAEPAPAEQSASEEAPSDQPPSEEAPSQMVQTESTPTEEALAEEESQDDILLKAKLDYIKLLIKSMSNAVEQKKLEKVSSVAKEIHKVASEANADQETGVSQPNEMTEEVTPEPQTESDPAESSDATSSAESGESQDENKTGEQAPEAEPESAENASAEKEDEKNQLSKFKIRIDVVPRSSNKKEEYYVNEEINLKIKVANLNLKDKTGPIHMQYYLLGKGTKNSGEYVLFDSGEESFELGKTQSDRSFEYSTDTFTNKYGVYGGSGNYKFDAWFVVVIDDEGNVIQTKSNKQNLKDYDLIKDMDKNFRYDKSFKKMDGARRYKYY
jgi:hypothetical protein